ncbi:MAG: hypothetical protein GF335_00625 [Candidatus Moranbacteria bacterium]|nr:hypothetical protein [Candidatus Moranbacteria bacterium]
MKNKIKLLSLAFIISAIILGCDNSQMPQEEQTDRQDQKQQAQPEMMQEQKDMEMAQESTPETGYVDIGVEKAKEMIKEKSDLIIVDVSPKYDQGHIPGAVNYYVGDGSLDKAIPTLNKDKPYLVYCHVDSASIAGAQKLVDAGFTEIYRLKGNYSAWKQAGYKIEK